MAVMIAPGLIDLRCASLPASTFCNVCRFIAVRWDIVRQAEELSNGCMTIQIADLNQSLIRASLREESEACYCAMGRDSRSA